MTDPLAKKTIRRITEALDRNQTGALSEIVQIVRKLSGQAAHVSIAELSELIGRDPTITQKVINAANTFGYNPSGHPIVTISEAIHTVGFQRVRNLTLSLMLAENAGMKLNNEEQREMAALAVCSGMLAQTLASSSSRSAIDPEMAFVGASLRNYGKLLMATFFVDEYVEARSVATAADPDKAYLDIFGITPLDLGHTLLKSTNLPEAIMASLQRVAPAALARPAATSEDEILLAAEFCVRVCEVAFDERIGPDEFDGAIAAIVQTFAKSFPVEVELVTEALATVDSMMSQLNLIIGVRDEASPANLKLRARAKRARLPARQPAAPPRTADQDRELRAESSFQLAEARLDALLQSAEPIDLPAIHQLLAKTIAEGLGLESCIAFLPDPFDAKKRRYSSAEGLGPLFDKIKNRPLVAPDNKDIFSICLARREDILIQDAKAGKIASVIPEWVHARGQVNSLILLPASHNDALFAIFAGSVTNGSPIKLEENDLRRLKVLRLKLAALVAKAAQARVR